MPGLAPVMPERSRGFGRRVPEFIGDAKCSGFFSDGSSEASSTAESVSSYARDVRANYSFVASDAAIRENPTTASGKSRTRFEPLQQSAGNTVAEQPR